MRQVCIAVLLVVLAAGCVADTSTGADEPVPASTLVVSATEPPTPEVVTPVVATAETQAPTETADASSIEGEAAELVMNQALVEEAANRVQADNGAFMIAVLDANGDTLQATVGHDTAGRAPAINDSFRIGSITKVFTALVILQLVEEGLVDLDTLAASYVTRVDVPDRVTVRHLLGHRSGIFDTTSVQGFISDLLMNQSRVWTPEEQLALIADRTPVAPGVTFSYSNSNYVLLGILIEEVTGLTYHQVVRSRILEPLELMSTYLAFFEDGTEPFDPYTNTSVVAEGEQYNFTSVASAAWAAGGMVSSAPDLHTLFTALFSDRIVSAELVAEMTSGGRYGLGLELNHAADGLLGHEGGMLGYSTFVRHSIDTGTTAFFALTDDGANPVPARRPILDALAQPATPG